jgi:hypothetical protein
MDWLILNLTAVACGAARVWLIKSHSVALCLVRKEIKESYRKNDYRTIGNCHQLMDY